MMYSVSVCVQVYVCVRARRHTGRCAFGNFVSAFGYVFHIPKARNHGGSCTPLFRDVQIFLTFFFFFFNIKPEEINKINASVRAT